MARANRNPMVLLAVSAILAGGACRKQTLADQEQIAASIGEVMASVDESTKGSGATARLPILRMPDEMKGPLWRQIFDGVVHTAYASSCLQSSFGACTAGTRMRTFASCEIGAATLVGSVALSYSDTSSCAVAVVGDSVTRSGVFTLTGPYGGTLAVNAVGGGQTLTKTAVGFDYSVTGIERVLTGPGGHTLFDISTRTTTPIHITGTSRADLVIVSGALEVSHNLAGYKVTLSPQNLTWSGSCNCAVSGTLTGTVSGGKHDGQSASVTLTGCGQAEVTIDGESDSVTVDRCASI
jgi:hypothetical protein